MTSRGYAVALAVAAVLTLIAWGRQPIGNLPPDWPAVSALTAAVGVAAGMTVSRFPRRER